MVQALPIFRCSELDRALRCNGSIKLTRLVAPRTGGEGDEGTALHWMGHDILKRVHGAVGELGLKPECKSAQFSSWMADFYARFISQTVLPSWSMEVEVGLAYTFARFILSGHIDCLAMSPDGTEAVGFDLKTGRDPVDEAEMNEQMFAYIVLLLCAYPELKKVTFYVIQPRNNEEDGDKQISFVTLEGTRLANAIPTLESRLNAALDNQREVDSGRIQCKWCPAALQCPAAIEEREAMKITLTDEALAAIRREPDDQTLADWVIAGKLLDRPFEDAKELAKKRIAERGQLHASDGTVITQKEQNGSWEWPDPPATYAAIQKMLPLQESQALVFRPRTTELKAEIARVYDCPKSSKSGVSGESLFNAHIAPTGTQKKKSIFQYSS